MSLSDEANLNKKYIDAKLRATSRKDDNLHEGDPQDRLPPGQRIVPRMVAMPPIIDSYPHVEKDEWRFQTSGFVENEKTWTWSEFLKLPLEDYTVDFHCVTHWSKLDQNFTGVPLAEIFKIVQPKNDVKYVVFECYDGYTTNVLYEELLNHTGFVAIKMDGNDILDKFGGPARVVIPHLYGWKSAKHVSGIRFEVEDEPGFWEVRGYHNHADPWKEERYSN